jgi:hypothetical protein
MTKELDDKTLSDALKRPMTLFDQIKEGLEEALSIARGNTKPANIYPMNEDPKTSLCPDCLYYLPETDGCKKAYQYLDGPTYKCGERKVMTPEQALVDVLLNVTPPDVQGLPDDVVALLAAKAILAAPRQRGYELTPLEAENEQW